MCVLLYFLTLWNKDGKINWYLCYNEKQGVGLTVCLLLKNIGQINIVYTFTIQFFLLNYRCASLLIIIAMLMCKPQ